MRYSDVSDEAAVFHLQRETATDPVVLCRFTIEGEPESKARPRFNRRTGVAFTPEKTQRSQDGVASAFRRVAPRHRPKADRAYGVTAIFFHGTMQRRDVDNMLKLILDGLNGHAWADDSQVTEVSGRKAVAEDGFPRTEVVVYELGPLQRMLTRLCKYCGQQFETYPSGTRIYCSPECNYARRRAESDAKKAACGICGERVKLNRSIYCSTRCMGIAKSRAATQRKNEARP